MKKIDPALQERLVTLITSMGYELVGCEALPQGRQMTLRIYIDGPNGVTADDCSKVAHQVGAMLDVEDPFQNRYTLEVSSPGIDRPLFEIEHYRKFVGSRIKLKLYSPINQRRQYTGILSRVEGEDIYLLIEAESEVKLPFSAIEKANVIGEVRL